MVAAFASSPDSPAESTPARPRFLIAEIKAPRTRIRAPFAGHRAPGRSSAAQGEVLHACCRNGRCLFDPTGAWNVNDALGAGATRTTREAIRAYLDQYNPGLSPAPPAPGLTVDTAFVVEQAPAPGKSDPTGSDAVQPAQAAVPLPTATDDRLPASIAAAIVARGGERGTLKASGGLDLCAVEVDTLNAGDEAAKAANLQAVDGLLRQWDPSPYEIPPDRPGGCLDQLQDAHRRRRGLG